MKLKVKVKLHDGQKPLEIIKKGDWIDLRANKDYTYHVGDMVKIDLGVSMKLPKGFEAWLVCRSSTPTRFKLILAHSKGIIDNIFSGTNDIWNFMGYAIGYGMVDRGDRVCQFRIQLSQKATVWQKIKWLLTSGIKFEYVDELDSEDRGSFGSTGVN